jgi:hypothetical protein
VFNNPHGQLGGDLVVANFSKAKANETNKKPSLALAKYYVLWEV